VTGRGPDRLHRLAQHLRLGGTADVAHATVTADLFHVVQPAKATGDVRRRVVRARYGRRGRAGDPEYGI
jgi:hypothetical protein